MNSQSTATAPAQPALHTTLSIIIVGDQRSDSQALLLYKALSHYQHARLDGLLQAQADPDASEEVIETLDELETISETMLDLVTAMERTLLTNYEAYQQATDPATYAYWVVKGEEVHAQKVAAHYQQYHTPA